MRPDHSFKKKKRKKEANICVLFGGKDHRLFNVCSASLCEVTAAISLLSACPRLYTTLVVILQEPMNTHENKMSSVGRSSCLRPCHHQKQHLTFVPKAKIWGLSKYEI